jgi:hypothetical protein
MSSGGELWSPSSAHHARSKPSASRSSACGSVGSDGPRPSASSVVFWPAWFSAPCAASNDAAASI